MFLAQRFSRCFSSRCKMATRGYPSHMKPLSPRVFPSSGFETIDATQLVEEERLPSYNHTEYYPVTLGQVLRGRYQVSAKLGYGTTSTVWLCHDLIERKYWALKIHVNTIAENNEKRVYSHLAGVTNEHSGREFIRQLGEYFELDGPYGKHEVFVMEALGMSLRTLQERQERHIFPQPLVVSALDQVLRGLDFLHEADVIHTDLHSDNLLIAIADDLILSKVEKDELCKPSARKQADDRTIYMSRYMLGGVGRLTICDLGQARIGSVHKGKAMPLPYRAPEVILGMEWGHPVDAWSLGLLAWDLLQLENLFDVYDVNDKALNDAYHLAAMAALLGPPPPEFLERSETTAQYWSKDGTWKGTVPIPSKRTMESLAPDVGEDDGNGFLDFVRGLLCWLPEERLTPAQAYFHPWLRKKQD